MNKQTTFSDTGIGDPDISRWMACHPMEIKKCAVLCVAKISPVNMDKMALSSHAKGRNINSDVAWPIRLKGTHASYRVSSQVHLPQLHYLIMLMQPHLIMTSAILQYPHRHPLFQSPSQTWHQINDHPSLHMLAQIKYSKQRLPGPRSA